MSKIAGRLGNCVASPVASARLALVCLGEHQPALAAVPALVEQALTPPKQRFGGIANGSRGRRVVHRLPLPETFPPCHTPRESAQAANRKKPIRWSAKRNSLRRWSRRRPTRRGIALHPSARGSRRAAWTNSKAQSLSQKVACR